MEIKHVSTYQRNLVHHCRATFSNYPKEEKCYNGTEIRMPCMELLCILNKDTPVVVFYAFLTQLNLSFAF